MDDVTIVSTDGQMIVDPVFIIAHGLAVSPDGARMDSWVVHFFCGKQDFENGGRERYLEEIKAQLTSNGMQFQNAEFLEPENVNQIIKQYFKTTHCEL